MWFYAARQARCVLGRKRNSRKMERLSKVLIIDDNEIDCFIMKKLLSSYDVSDNVIAFTSATEGLKYIKTNCFGEPAGEEGYPDLIFLDIEMPIMDGIQLLENLKNQEDIEQCNLHIVILSSTLDRRVLDKAVSFKNLVYGYLNKPITEAELKQVLVGIWA